MLFYNTISQVITKTIKNIITNIITNTTNAITNTKTVVNGIQSSFTLDNRMRNYIKNNNKQCHGFKPFVITIKSKQLSEYINNITDFHEKVKLLNTIQDIFFETSKIIYTKFDPHLIYTFQNEINVVFFYNDTGTFIYNGDINKIVTNIVSVVSIEVYKRLCQPNFDLNFHGHFVEFDVDYEVLNYLVWRQMDCKRNTITLLYRCYNEYNDECDNLNVEGIKVLDMVSVLNNKTGIDINQKYIYLLTGNIIKKYLFYKIKNENDENIIVRRSVGIENIYFSDNFKMVLRKYIINKIN
jgi:tRNA(His) 5'-end guanylyltransferase